MNTQEYTDYTNKLLSKVAKDDIRFALSKTVMEDIERSNNAPNFHDRDQVTEFKAVADRNFGIPSGAASMPYITGIHENNKITLTTIEPAKNKLKTGSAVSDKLRPNNALGFRTEIKNINKTAFTNGLDLDNFTVLNISKAPLHKDILKELTKSGGIVPLSSKFGIFVPKFALKDATFSSLEYEGRFVPISSRNSINFTADQTAHIMQGIDIRSFESMVTNPVKHDYGININNLFTHSIESPYSPGHSHYSPYSFRLDDDISIERRPNTKGKEVVLGASTLSNMIMATHIVMSSWNKRGAVRNEDRIMDQSSGMHISTTVPSLVDGLSRTKASNYLNHAGIIIDALSRTTERWKSYGYQGVRDTYTAHDRADFRLDTSSQRLEHRYPGSVFDIAHIADQLIMANKINSDVENYIKNASVTREHQIRGNRYTVDTPKMSGDPSKALPVLKTLHNPNATEHRAMNEWFNSFMEVLGITDDISKKFVKGMNAKCVNSPEASRY